MVFVDRMLAIVSFDFWMGALGGAGVVLVL